MLNLSITTHPLSDLTPDPRNARTLSKKQIKQLAQSIETFGFTNPLLIGENNTLLAGHGRLEAAKFVGMSEVPCVRFDHLTADQRRACIIADNKLALKAGWDEAILAEELSELLDSNLEFSIESTGFSIAEIDVLIEEQAAKEAGDPADDILPGTSKIHSRC